MRRLAALVVALSGFAALTAPAAAQANPDWDKVVAAGKAEGSVTFYTGLPGNPTTKKIGDACQELGVPMVLHMAGTPIACMAAVQCAAATENFLVMENHSVDVPWWGDMVNGVEKPVVSKGYISVPEGPGLGIGSLNDEVIKQHLMEPGYFEPTPEWDKERSHDRLWS